jgi:hypothetical protein
MRSLVCVAILRCAVYSSYIVIGSVYPEVWRLKNCKEVSYGRYA